MIGITPGFEDMAVALCVSLAESGPVRVDEFDDAWTPAGENYRDELVSGGLVTVSTGGEEEGPAMIALTAAGAALASAPAAVVAEPAEQP